MQWQPVTLWDIMLKLQACVNCTANAETDKSVFLLCRSERVHPYTCLRERESCIDY